MKAERWLFAAVPVGLTLLLAFILFVPVVLAPGDGTMTECNPQTCVVGIQQYESVSYAYGGWGAVFQTGVNWYRVDGWVCMCPAEVSGHIVPCCVPPYGWLIWSVVWLLAGADLVGVVGWALKDRAKYMSVL